MVPFIKWAGGKRQLLPELRKRMPKTFNTYYEPFVGGGALLFDLQPDKAIINDMNKELMSAYKSIKGRTYKRVLELLILMEWGHDKDQKFFNKVRSLDKLTKKDNRGLEFKDFSDSLTAARFIYLNKACFNGMYRVNGSGYFNTPSAKKDKVKTYEMPNMKRVHDFLKDKDVVIRCGTYTKAVEDAKKGDFVYLDPPYDYEKGVNGFDAYQKGGFGIEGQKELAQVCKDLDAKGVKFMLSNNNTELIQELYIDFNIDIVMARRSINSDGEKRGKVEEVIVRNYVS